MKKTILATAEKMAILQNLQEVVDSNNSLWSLSMGLFIENSHKKTDPDYVRLVETIQDSMIDNSRVMQEVLGKHFYFFAKFEIYEQQALTA